MLLESYISTTPLTWLGYATLAIAIVLCGGAFACFNCSLFDLVLNSTLFSMNVLQRAANDLLRTIKEHFSATNDTAINHHILNIRPEYGVDINKIINDITSVFSCMLMDYPVSERPKKCRSPPRKFDVRGWRRRLNARWKKRMIFKLKQVPSNDFPGESSGYSFPGESSSYSNSRTSHLEQLIIKVPQRDTDPNLDKTLPCYPRLRKSIYLKGKADGTRIAHWE